MKIYFSIVWLLLLPAFASAQESLPDSIRLERKLAANDSMRFAAAEKAVYFFVELNRDSLMYYTNECLTLAQKSGRKLEEAWALASIGYTLTGMGEYSRALGNFLKAFELVENPENEKRTWLPSGQTAQHRRLYYLSYTNHLFAILMANTRNYEQAIHHFTEAKRIAEEINVPRGVIWANMNLGLYYLASEKPDSALMFAQQAKELALKTPGEEKYLGLITLNLANILRKKGETTQAKKLYKEAIEKALKQKNFVTLTSIYTRLATSYNDEHEKDSSIMYARKALESVQVIGENSSNVVDMGLLYKNLYSGYLLNNEPDSALRYASLAIAAKESLSEKEIKSLAEFQKLSLKEQLRVQNLEKERVVYRNNVRTWAMIAGLIFFVLIAYILFRNNRKKQKANRLLEQALLNLKSTQSQLIQSEKMASLGELTAGIAHEIQNPLNFVNNFSEVNTELIEELKKELAVGSGQWAVGSKQLVEELIDDIKINEEKINHHGKRADAIVKGMLQHSRTSSGQKESTDINALCDEYLRLSYHGLRAKDKSFNAKLDTHFDSFLPTVNIVQQDIGRVVLNLINNAFYAVSEKSKQHQNNYDPTVSVTTKKSGDKILISIKDNGNGIPESIKEKIFQPFFTTKPTGQGTGLGLSLSYDIVKAHGGALKVVTKDREGSEFIIQLRTD